MDSESVVPEMKIVRPVYETLIQPGALANRLQDDGADTLVCDCRFDLADAGAGRVAYDAGHISGAAWLSLDDVLSGPRSGRNGRHPLPGRDVLAGFMAALGASAGTQIVAYDADNGMFAARLWWLMRWLGHAGVAVRDGGFAAWQRAGLHVEHSVAPARAAGDFTPRPPLTSLVQYQALRSAIEQDRTLILDARAPDRFAGQNETLDPVGGHVPGARNQFFRANLDPDGRFKPADVLKTLYAAAIGPRLPAEVVSMCGSGVTACHNLLAMQVAGLGGAGLYAGSWSEWCAQPDAPLA